MFPMARRPRPHHGPFSGGQARRRLLNRTTKTTKTIMAVSFDRGRLLPTARLIVPRGQEASPCHPPRPCPCPPCPPWPRTAAVVMEVAAATRRARDMTGRGMDTVQGRVKFAPRVLLLSGARVIVVVRKTRQHRQQNSGPSFGAGSGAPAVHWAHGGDGDNSSEDTISSDDSEGSDHGDSPDPTARRLGVRDLGVDDDDFRDGHRDDELDHLSLLHGHRDDAL